MAKNDFDAVLMDVRMPGMDGLEAPAAVRPATGPGDAAPAVPIFGADLPLLDEGVFRTRAGRQRRHVPEMRQRIAA